jgi:hypothetical protein
MRMGVPATTNAGKRQNLAAFAKDLMTELTVYIDDSIAGATWRGLFWPVKNEISNSSKPPTSVSLRFEVDVRAGGQ